MIIIAIRFRLLARVAAKTLQSGFDLGGDLLDGVVAINLFKAALFAVVLNYRGGLGFEGLHALGEDSLGVVGTLNESGAIYITDAGGTFGGFE